MTEETLTNSDTICFMKLDGEYIKCKLDADTGEWIKIRPYNRNKRTLKAKLDDGTTTDLTWSVELHVDDVNNDDDVRDFNIPKDTRGRKPKVYDNSAVKTLLSPCQTYDSASKTFPFFDNIITSVAGLHDGSRPISVHLLFKLLCQLDSVTTNNVQVSSGKSESYSKKLSMAVQVASRELAKKLDGFVFDYVYGELPILDKEQLLLDRQIYVQWFKDQQLAGLYSGVPVPK